jgi:hypothetical protein
MRTTAKTSLALLVLGASAWIITAQDTGTTPPSGDRPPRHARPDGPPPGQDGPRGPGEFRPHHPPPPIIAALDANKDGVIDETEIANAVAALKTLDKNGDGKLTFDELMPPPPWRDGPPPRGPRPPGPDGEQPEPPQN